MGQELGGVGHLSCFTKSTDREKQKHLELGTLVYVSLEFSSALISACYTLTQIYYVFPLQTYSRKQFRVKENLVSLPEVLQL